MSFAEKVQKTFEAKFGAADSKDEMTLLEYLELCKTDKMAYASAPERMLAAIGEPVIVDTNSDARSKRIFSSRVIRTYPAFKDFFGGEDAIERLVSYFRLAAQGLEESKQILYLKGPVGGGKSSLVEKLKSLMEVFPIYVLKDPQEKNPELAISPMFENPLGLFDKSEHGAFLQEEYGISPAYLNTVPSGWALEKLKEFGGDITKFNVVRIKPNKHTQVGIMKVEPGDENNQDVSVLIGKTDMRKLSKYPQDHPYAYSYSGGLNRTNQGILDFAEMFKANIKTLSPLLTATQERNIKGTENVPAMPFTGIICAHSNEAEWFKFRNDQSNEAFLDRVYIVNVPYCLRTDEEVKIYEKMLQSSTLNINTLAPQTLRVLAEFMVLTRLVEPDNSTIYAKMKVYNGENVKDTMPSVKPIEEYRDTAGVDEGMTGLSTRMAFKMLSSTFNLRPDELQANPVDLMYVIEETLKQERLPDERFERYLNFVKSWCQVRYFEFIDKELQIAYLESYSNFGQTMFERYFLFAESWLDDSSVRDPDTHVMLEREQLNQKLENIEKAAGIVNAKDFRNDIVNYALRYKAKNRGELPKWNQYEKIKAVIEKKMFAATQDIIPIVSFGPKGSADDQKKHDDFIARMVSKGYTEKQIKNLVKWWLDNKKSA